jgi:endonuclease I
MLGKNVSSSYAKGLRWREEILESQSAAGRPVASGRESGTLIRQRRSTLALFLVAALLCRLAAADAYDPPASYYNTANGTGATLKSQLHTIISTGDTSRSYDDLRSDLQVTDAVVGDSSKIRVVYNNGVPITKVTVGSIPGWDSGVTWNREHSWPQSRGVDTTSTPDGSDMFHLFPSKNSDNNTRGNLNYGGAFGQQNRGQVSDGGTKYYPGDADAGLVARAEFYMAVRYNGTETNTQDLELAAGDPADNGTKLGDLNRLLEWHFAAPPDTFERNRNKIIYDTYQHNRNPFIDHPEYVWSVFAKDSLGNDIQNNSQITIASATTVDLTTGESGKTVDLGRILVHGTVPAPQTFTLNKSGTNGTYFEVNKTDDGYSPSLGRFNAFRTNQTDSKSISIGLDANTTNVSSAGKRSGTVKVDNLDITCGTCAGEGSKDADDTFNVSLNVLDHMTPSFAVSSTTLRSLDFGNIAIGSSSPTLNFDVFDLNGVVNSTASMDFDSFTPSGNSSAFTTNLGTSAGSLQIAAGASHTFAASLNLTSIGTFTAIYTLNFSDEDLTGAQNKSLTLTLTGKVRLAGDFNGDGRVDAGDYVVWQRSFGQSVAAAYSGADGDGNLTIDNADYDVWRSHFGQTAAGSGSSLSQSLATSVPEPATLWLLAMCAALVCHSLRRAR